MDILQQAQQGDLKAFARLIDQHKAYVYTIIYRIVGSKVDAEEASQDVFVKVFKKLNSYNGESKFTTWLYSIAYRTAIDHKRKMNRIPAYAGIDENISKVFVANSRTDESLDITERRNYLNKAIDMLNDEQAAVITLYYLRDYNIEEIREITEMTKSNIKVILYRARIKLKEIIQNNFQNELNDYE